MTSPCVDSEDSDPALRCLALEGLPGERFESGVKLLMRVDLEGVDGVITGSPLLLLLLSDSDSVRDGGRALPRT